MSLLCQALSAPRPFMLPGQQRRLHGLFQPHPCPPLLDYLWLGLAPPLAAWLPALHGTGAVAALRLFPDCRHFGNVDIFINYNLQVVWAPYQLHLSSGLVTNSKAIHQLPLMVSSHPQTGQHRYGEDCVSSTTGRPNYRKSVHNNLFFSSVCIATLCIFLICAYFNGKRRFLKQKQ